MATFPRNGITFAIATETDGRCGLAFAIAALVLNEDGKEMARFVGRLPDSVVINDRTKITVLPVMKDHPVTHRTYEEMTGDFAKFYLAYKKRADVVVHMGGAEAKIFCDMCERGLIDEQEIPYPLYDVSGNLQAAGADPTSVDAYAAKHGIRADAFMGGHLPINNPLYGAALLALVYRKLTKKSFARAMLDRVRHEHFWIPVSSWPIRIRKCKGCEREEEFRRIGGDCKAWVLRDERP